MSRLVATLISNPVRPQVTHTAIDAVKRAFVQDRATVAGFQVLHEGVAADVFLDAIPLADARVVAARMSDALAIDIAVQPEEGRRKQLLVADMDSTIIAVECIDEIADMVGVKDQVARITEAAMRGELDFVGALKERVAMLAGLEEAALEKVFTERVRLNPGARTLIQTMNKNGAKTVLISGGFTFFTSRVAELTGFQVTRANTLEFKNGKLTGQVVPPIVDSATKKATLLEFAAQVPGGIAAALALGDGANDIPMIEAAGLGVAYHAKPKAAAAADVSIRYGDLTAVLYLQGYRAEEFEL
jgi:phosphoserine phosphatase